MPNTPVTFTQAIEGYLITAESRKLSVNTINDYLRAFRKFSTFIGGRDSPPTFTEINADDVRAFMASLTVGKKTALNHHTALSALWKWGIQKGLVTKNVVREVTPPAPKAPVVDPFAKSEVVAMLAVIDQSRRYTRRNHPKESTRHKLTTAQRNRAIILMLLDTGVRASELCGLNMFDLDLKQRRATIKGKGDKTRIVPFSPTVAESLWDYLRTRGDMRQNDPIFVSHRGRRISRRDLAQLIARIGGRAGVKGAHPHRFRHTFAIEFLRKRRGDLFTLQAILGHSDLAMVRRYCKLAEVDITEAHIDASPVSTWQL